MRVARTVILGVIAILLFNVVAVGAIVWRNGGYRAYIVHTGSMMPTLNPGGLVIDRPAPTADQLHPGEIITFRHSDATTDVVTHRITNLKRGYIHTKGDANRTPDVWNIRPDQVRGSVAQYVPYLGYVVVFFRQKAGIAALMTGILATVMLWGLFFPAAASEPRRRVLAPPGAPATT